MAATSSSRKRSYDQFDSEDSQISIRLTADAAGAPPLLADRHLLLAVSACARGLAPDAAEWDLSHFVIEGQPVTREVVVAWLHAAHQCIHEEPYAAEAQQDPPLAHSAAGLAQLLAFADAVGSSRGLLTACLSELDRLQFHVQAGEQQLRLEPARVYLWSREDEFRLLQLAADLIQMHEAAAVAGSEAKAQVMRRFVQQLEVLLYLAHKLRLGALQRLLHTCVQRNQFSMRSPIPICQSDMLGTVMSARVLDAAAGPVHASQLAFINSVVSQTCGFVNEPGLKQLFKPVGLTPQQLRPIKFSAELTEDFLAAGSKGQVLDVELDLFGSLMTVGCTSVAVQLHVGLPLPIAAFEALKATQAPSGAT